MASRTPGQIQQWLDTNSHLLDLSVQYLGSEPNAVRRPWPDASVRTCLVAAWAYEAAAGNQSIPAVYKTINDHRPDFLCDRAYLPNTPRDLKMLEKSGIPMFGVESKHQLADFDVIGTSISYPVLAMSFVKLLKMSDIPVRWKEREADGLEHHPMVIAGGLAYGAPEVLAPVVDCWFLGEVEDEPGNPGLGAVITRIAAFKEQGSWDLDRLQCYRSLALEYPFLYFPRFIDVHYAYVDRTAAGVGPHQSKQVVGYTSNLEGLRLPLRKRHVRDLDRVAPLDNPPLLFADPAMGSGDLEVGRGCPAWCSFCALSYRSKPYRQRSVSTVVQYAETMQDNLGSTRMAPFMPDLPMYTQPKKLIAELLANVSDEVDGPAMRVDDFVANNDFILLQVHGGMDAVTLGVEGGSQRMRDLIGKGVSDADIREAVTRGIRAGIRKIKLFFISNLPGEDEGDIVRVLKLAKDLADIRENMRQPTVRIQFSWTPLLIEGNTPLQWFAPTPQSRILGDVWDSMRDLKIDFKLGAKAQPDKLAFFQLCQRASRDVGEALVDAIDDADQATWGGFPRTFKDDLAKRLRAHGFANDYADCFDERQLHDMFGWEFIDQGVSVQLMWRVYQQMREFIEQTDSHTYDRHFNDSYRGAEWLVRCDERCYGKSCGVCSYDDLRIRQSYLQSAKHDIDIDLARVGMVDQRSQAYRVRARITKPLRYRFVSNDHWRFNLRRAAFRAQRRLKYEGGIAKRSIRFASDEVKHRDYTHGVDYVEFGMTRPLTTIQMHDFLQLMNYELGEWMDIDPISYVIHSAKATTLRADVDLTLYELQIEAEPRTVLTAIAAWRAADTVPMRLRIEAGYFAPAAETVNAKTYVDDLWLIRDGHRLLLRMLVRGRPTPYNIYAALMRQPGWLDAARLPATRLDAFVETDRRQQDFVRPNCQDCGLLIPVNVLDEPYHLTHCPVCLDRQRGVLVDTHDDPGGAMPAKKKTNEDEQVTQAIPPTAPADDSAPATAEGTEPESKDPSNTPIWQLVEPLEDEEGDRARLLAEDTSGYERP